jgi:hypothetical protein
MITTAIHAGTTLGFNCTRVTKAVESVGDGGGDEHRRGQQFALAVHPQGEALAAQDPDQHRDAEDAGKRDVVRQIHFETAEYTPNPRVRHTPVRLGGTAM